MNVHPSVTAYLDACNTRDVERLMGCFAPDALVQDEAKTYRGAAEIQSWFLQTVAEYDFNLECRHAVAEQGSNELTCRVSGTFDGSPISLRFLFTLEQDRIAALTIRP
jgi:ketosteroid isomerase-like protein